MNHAEPAPWPSPTGVAEVLDDVLRTAGPEHRRPPLTYLRRKSGRGMVAVYGDAGSARSMYTVTVEESAMSGRPTPAGPPPPAGEAATPHLPQIGGEDGMWRVADLGLTIQRFPHDEAMPHLAEAVAPQEHTPLWQALADAARCWQKARGDEADLALVSVEAVPLRYKPGDRCVIRYNLRLESPSGSPERFSVIGKLYQNSEEATEAARIMRRLWQAQGSRPWSARPLGVADPLPLVLTEDLGSDRGEHPTRAGTEVIRFGPEQPVEALRLAARALAELHTSSTASNETAIRTGEGEAAKAAKRAKVIAQYVPTLADTTASVTTTLRSALTAMPARVLRPSHGSIKPSQLLFRSDSVYVVDFDQFAWADPALDVGYFLAYLRPPGLWYRRAGTRSWFAAAAATFLSAYDEAAAERGMGSAERQQVLRRCHVYEAALLMKIAARRPNRLHSPRPGEVRALLEEAMTCLAAAELPQHPEAGRVLPVRSGSGQPVKRMPSRIFMKTGRWLSNSSGGAK